MLCSNVVVHCTLNDLMQRNNIAVDWRQIIWQ